MPPVNIRRETLVEQVAQALIDHIYTESLKPGDALPSTTRLATDFDVSRPVIREALKTLEGQGIIEVSNGRNAIVKPITGDTLRRFFTRALALNEETVLELLEIRRGIEVQSAILAAERRTDTDLEQIQSVLMQMRDVIKRPEAYARLDLKLHLLIAAASHNQLMYHLIESIRDALHNTILEGLRSRGTPEQLERVQQIHEDIVQQIARKDSKTAAEAMGAHFDDAISAVFARGGGQAEG